MGVQTQTRRALEAQVLLHSADLQEAQHRHEVRLAAAQELSRAPVRIGAARFERIAEALAVLEVCRTVSQSLDLFVQPCKKHRCVCKIARSPLTKR